MTCLADLKFTIGLLLWHCNRIDLLTLSVYCMQWKSRGTACMLLCLQSKCVCRCSGGYVAWSSNSCWHVMESVADILCLARMLSMRPAAITGESFSDENTNPNLRSWSVGSGTPGHPWSSPLLPNPSNQLHSGMQRPWQGHVIHRSNKVARCLHDGLQIPTVFFSSCKALQVPK